MKYDDFLSLVRTHVGVRTIVRLLPAGGPNSKVFPPTYSGGVYAIEDRLVDGERKKCVLLDSVASQANRMEETLQDAIDRNLVKIPLLAIDLSNSDLNVLGHRLTSLQAPHRIADALFRESELNGQPFRESDLGKKVFESTPYCATSLYETCPTSLLFGMWDSTGPMGGSGNKFERAITSEIVGINSVFGVATSSRIDPLIPRTESEKIYEGKDGEYTLDPNNAKHEKGKPVLYKKMGMDGKEKGNLSAINLGNITPSVIAYSDNSTIENPLTNKPIRPNDIAARGVTLEYAEQTCVISFAALRKLRFPSQPHESSTDERDESARAVLAALGLVSFTRMLERGLDLRSRCVLVPEKSSVWTALGNKNHDFELDSKTAISLLNESVEAAKKIGVTWNEEQVLLNPSRALLELIQRTNEPAKQSNDD